jgi:hypothetical protein
VTPKIPEQLEGGLVQGAVLLGFAAARAGVAGNPGLVLEPLRLSMPKPSRTDLMIKKMT